METQRIAPTVLLQLLKATLERTVIFLDIVFELLYGGFKGLYSRCQIAIFLTKLGYDSFVGLDTLSEPTNLLLERKGRFLDSKCDSSIYIRR